MEDIASSYYFVIVLKEDIQSGHSIRQSIRGYLKAHNNDFTPVLLSWMVSLENGTLKSFYDQYAAMTSFQRALFHLLERANQGGSILFPLQDLEIEMRMASHLQIDDHLGKLPYKLMIPLLLLQFPSLLLLILGPLVLNLIKEI